MRYQHILSGLLITLLITFTTPASSATEDNELQKLVDELRELSNKSRQNRAADRWLQQALDDLVDRYDWPWRQTLLNEDFMDGNFTKNPSWQVLTGEFWIDRRLGLRSRVSPPVPVEPAKEETKKEDEEDTDIGRALIGAILEGALSDKDKEEEKPGEPAPAKRSSPEEEPARIRLKMNIPLTFALETSFSLHNRPDVQSQFDWLVMQDTQQLNAYKMIIISARNKTLLDIVRFRGDRESLLDSIELKTPINDGETHKLAWRQTADGKIDVLMDGKVVSKLQDKAFRNGFRWLALANRAGDLAVSEVKLWSGR